MTNVTGQWAGIKSIYFSSKHIVTNGNFRNSYAIIHNVTTITETQPGMTFDPPIILPPGFVINGEFSNASSETQNMILQITGYLTNQQRFAKVLGLGVTPRPTGELSVIFGAYPTRFSTPSFPR